MDTFKKTKFIALIESQGKSIGYLSALLGISRTSVYYKLGGKTQFTPVEIKKLKDEFALSDSQVNYYFID